MKRPAGGLYDEFRRVLEHKFPALESGGVLVAYSGGADSTALLHLFTRLSHERALKLGALHVHHCIRGDEADRDLEACRAYTAFLGVKFFEARVDAPSYALEKGLSLEMAARVLRYREIENLLVSQGYDFCATGHHSGDQAETILNRLFRGTSPEGLAGIPWKNGQIIRPLLGFCPESLNNYCRENSLPYVTDSTNLTGGTDRNYIRNLLIPAILDRFPAALDNLASLANDAAEENVFWENHSREYWKYFQFSEDGFRVDRELFNGGCEEPLFRRMLSDAVSRIVPGYRFTRSFFSSIRTVYNRNGGSRILWKSNELSCRSVYGSLDCRKVSENFSNAACHVKIESCGKGRWTHPLGRFVLCGPLSPEGLSGREGCMLQADIETLIPGNLKAGERFRRKAGSRKISDILVDLKVDRELRPYTVVFRDKEAAALYIPGHGFMVAHGREQVDSASNANCSILFEPAEQSGGFDQNGQ